MTIDISKIRPGDRVTLGGTFEVERVEAQDKFLPVCVRGVGSEDDADDGLRWVTADMIVAHHPAPRFKVGDVVYAKGQVSHSHILALDGDTAWIKNSNGGWHHTVHVAFLSPGGKSSL